jgi:hypothetical protein
MNLSKIFDGKKFMWDGMEYKDEKEAQEVLSKYQKDGFESYIYKENDKFYVFTRKVVTEVKIES